MRKIERIILKFFYCSINQKTLQENVHDPDPFFLSADQGSGSASNQNQMDPKHWCQLFNSTENTCSGGGNKVK